MEATLTKSSREPIIFENQGQKIFGVLHHPKEVKNAPLVIFLHGYASTKVGTNRSFVRVAEALAEQGIASLRFDFRGAGDSEGDFGEMTISSLISDAVAAVNFAKENLDIDENRIGFMGSSLGGAVAVLAAAQLQMIKSLVLWAPVASGQLWYKDWMLRNPELAKKAPNEALSTYQRERVSPIFQQEYAQLHAPGSLELLGSVPLLHIHGEDDDLISLAHQKAYHAVRGPDDENTRFIVYPDTPHIIGLSAHFPTIVKETVTWYQDHM